MSQATLHRTISHLRYVGDDPMRAGGNGPITTHLERLRPYFLEVARIRSLRLTLTWLFPGSTSEQVGLFLSASMPADRAQEAADFLEYTGRSFDTIHLAAEAFSGDPLRRRAGRFQHGYSGRLTRDIGLLLIPDLPIRQQSLIEMSQRLFNLEVEMALRISIAAIAPDRAAELIPRLHAIGAMGALEQAGTIELPPTLDPLGGAWGAAQGPLHAIRNHLLEFRIEVFSAIPLEDRVRSIVSHGLAATGPLASLHFVEQAAPAVEADPVTRLASLTHATNAGLVFQLPLAEAFCTHLQVENPPRLEPPPGSFAGGVKIGELDFFRNTRELAVSERDLSRHAYILGKTGSGKTTMLKTMVASLVERGNQAVFVIDPHGDMARELLAWVPPELAERTLYLDFGDSDHFPGLNILEAASEREREFAIGELDQMFLQLYGPEIWGPRLQDAFRNLAALLSLDPDGPGTLVDLLWAISLGNTVVLERFQRTAAAAKERAVTLRIFLNQVREQQKGYGSIEELTSYFRSKFSPFVDSLYLRNILGQKCSTLRFNDLARERRFCIFNLSKGRLSSRYAALIGRVLTTRLFQVAISSTEIEPDKRPPVALFIDEFQNFVSPAIEDILAEARKFRLSLVLANQFLAQLGGTGFEIGGQSRMLEAILGNVGCFACFRISGGDAQKIATELGSRVTADQLASLPNWHAVCRLSKDSIALPPFSCRTSLLPPAKNSMAAEIARRSRDEVCRPRAVVEAEIAGRITSRLGLERPGEDTMQAALELLSS